METLAHRVVVRQAIVSASHDVKGAYLGNKIVDMIAINVIQEMENIYALYI